MSNPYNPANWYWVVGGSTTQVYSSAEATYVAVTDTTYQAWLAEGNAPTQIDTDAHLQVVLYRADIAIIQIISTSTSAVNGTYRVNQQTKLDITGIVDEIVISGTFPGGGSTFAWPDASGAAHVFPSVALFKEFAVAVAGYVAQVEAVDSGLSSTSPTTQITIA